MERKPLQKFAVHALLAEGKLSLSEQAQDRRTPLCSQIVAVAWDTFILLPALNYHTVVQYTSSKWPHSFSEVGAVTRFLYIDLLKYKMLLLFFSPLVVVLNICFSISHYYVTETVC